MSQRLLPGDCALKHINQAAHRAFLGRVGWEDVVEGGPAEVDVHEQGSLTRPGARGSQVERGGALAVARLGAGYQYGYDRTPAIGDPQQAGPDVPERVGLDR